MSLIANKSVPVPLTEIKFVDHPQIQINKHESTQMPFRYMLDDNLMPIMPQVGRPVIFLVCITPKRHDQIQNSNTTI